MYGQYRLSTFILLLREVVLTPQHTTKKNEPYISLSVRAGIYGLLQREKSKCEIPSRYLAQSFKGKKTEDIRFLIC